MDHTSELSYDEEDVYPLEEEEKVEYYEDDSYSEYDDIYEDPNSYLYRHHKGEKRSKKDKKQKNSYFEKNFHKVNKVA
jgi:hypothetical protein